MIERHALPVVTSPRAKGILPEACSMSLGGYGIAQNEWSRRYIHRGIDALTVVGSGLGQWTTGGWDRRLAPRGPLVHVDVRADVPGRNYAATSPVCADAAQYLDALIEYGLRTTPHRSAEPRRSSLIERVRQGSRWQDDTKRASLETPLKPQRVMSELQAVLSHHPECQAGVNLFCDVGNALGWAWQHLVLGLPHRFWCNTSMGALGWASGAVIGGKLARPSMPAIALLSEAALLMNGVEISAAVEQRVGAVWLVLSERGMPSIEPMPESSTAAPCGWQSPCSLGSANLLEFARSLGAPAVQVSEPGALVRSLGEALEAAAKVGLPQVLVIHVDPGEQPGFPHLLTRDWSRSSR
jgi:acetolactate synthase-1/2/3 large subunit